ncbi:proepiregulin-like [Nematolebias whitei]|uniref:proepiregulin-like n=1 Tax=Nematolebias whitei TaxID=451745 RepID=UPI0018988A9B|nr:proepiregulin-like [Nematolebias whitei]
MGNSKTSALLSLIGVLLICPHVLTKSISPTLQTAENSTLTPGEGEERPPVVERHVMSCSSSFDNFCMNNGKCMLLVDLGEHHCKCEEGFHGSRCDSPEFVTQPLDKEQILIIIFCVILLMIGLTGALYFCCKWYKKNKFPRQQKQTDYKRVQKI